MTIAATDQLHLSIVRYITLIVITIQVIKKNIAISSSGSITCIHDFHRRSMLQATNEDHALQKKVH